METSTARSSRPPRGTGPDIFTYAHDSLGNFVESGIVAPFDLSQIADQYQDVAVEAFTYKVRPTGCRMRSRTLPSSATPIWCRLHPPPSRLEQVALQLKSDGTVEVPLAIQQAPTADPYHNYPMFSGGGGYVFGQPGRLAQPAGPRHRLAWRSRGCRAVGEVDEGGPRVRLGLAGHPEADVQVTGRRPLPSPARGTSPTSSMPA